MPHLNEMNVFVNDDADELSATLFTNGAPQDLTGCSVVSRVKFGSAATVETPVTITTPETLGHVHRPLTAGEKSTIGRSVVEFVVTFAGGARSTWPSPNEDANALIVHAART